MVGKDMDPADIGKYPKIIKAAQMDMSQTDVLVCGKCHSIFHFIELFQEHREEGCDRESALRDCRETKPKVWAFLLWKAAQLNNNDAASNSNSWKLYQQWVKLDESLRETWIVAGKTIQSFAKIGTGNLQEMPVKITKTVIDNPPKTSAAPNRFVNKINESRAAPKKAVQNDNDPDDPPFKPDPVKVVRKTLGTSVSQTTPKLPSSITLYKNVSRRANRTLPNTNNQQFEEETVEKIIAKRFNPRRKMHEYLVKWEGYPHDQNTWEPQTHLERCPQLLETFEKQLARQKEQRAAQAAKQAALNEQQSSKDQKPQPVVNILPTSSAGRPARNSKAKALDQVKQWCADEETTSSNGKRKLDDSDFEDNPPEIDDFEDDQIPVHAVKRLKNGSTISVKVDPKTDAKITTIQPQTTIIKAINGTVRQTKGPPSAEVIITKDSNTSGVVRKSGATGTTNTQKNEAQIRVISKGDNSASGVVRITSVTGNNKLTTTASPRITQVNRNQNNSSNQAQISQVQTHRILLNTKEKQGSLQQQTRNVSSKLSSPNSGTRTIQGQPKTTIIQRTSLSANVNQSQTSGKMIINRNVRSAPSSKAVTPEQKIIQLSKSGDLKVTRKVITHSPQQQQQHKLVTHQKQIKIEDSSDTAMMDDDFPESPQQRHLTLCPTTGKILAQAEGEPSPVSNKTESVSQTQSPQSGVFHAQPPVSAEQQANEELSVGLTLATEDGQQQILANEDGTPLLVTGEDGTIYQVAGKNAEGQTILIAQGADGEQQFAYVAEDDGEEGGVLALDNAVAEAVAQMLPEQQAEALAAAAAAGGEGAQFIIKQDEAGNTTMATSNGPSDETQALTIQTGDSGDSADGNIPAEVVQADLPSPGGTRRVVLLLQDGTFMMTEMHDDEYQALNLAS